MGKKSKKFYVYTHRDKRQKENNGIFYVGKGVGNRAFDFKRRNPTHLERIKNIKNLGYKPKIVFEFTELDNETANLIEMEMIGDFGRVDEDKVKADYYDNNQNKIRNGFPRIIGTLVNQTDGGEGGVGVKWTEDRIKKARDNVSGNKNPMYGKTGYESVRGKEVICLNDGRIFGSSLECAKFYKISHEPNVRSTCNASKKSCEGKIFAWYEDYKNKNLPKNHGQNLAHFSYEIIELDSDKKEINKWINAKDCALKENLSWRSIQRVCRGQRKTYKGRIFKYGAYSKQKKT